jgi:hypothetical protein
MVNPNNLAIRPDNGDVLIQEDRYDRFVAPTPGYAEQQPLDRGPQGPHEAVRDATGGR